MLLNLLFSLAIAGSLGAYALYQVFRLIYQSPLKLLPGPKSTHLLYGNLR
jgi:hypothetical protein